jgi:hypothetical protein
MDRWIEVEDEHEDAKLTSGMRKRLKKDWGQNEVNDDDAYRRVLEEAKKGEIGDISESNDPVYGGATGAAREALEGMLSVSGIGGSVRVQSTGGLGQVQGTGSVVQSMHVGLYNTVNEIARKRVFKVKSQTKQFDNG